MKVMGYLNTSFFLLFLASCSNTQMDRNIRMFKHWEPEKLVATLLYPEYDSMIEYEHDVLGYNKSFFLKNSMGRDSFVQIRYYRKPKYGDLTFFSNTVYEEKTETGFTSVQNEWYTEGGRMGEIEKSEFELDKYRNLLRHTMDGEIVQDYSYDRTKDGGYIVCSKIEDVASETIYYYKNENIRRIVMDSLTYTFCYDSLNRIDSVLIETRAPFASYDFIYSPNGAPTEVIIQEKDNSAKLEITAIDSSVKIKNLWNGNYVQVFRNAATRKD
jgi:hypothetical protein